MSSQSPELPPPGATPTTPTLPPETNATSLPPTVTPPEATLPPPTEVTSPPPFPDTNVTSSTTPPAPTATNETTPATSNVPTSTNGSGVSSGLPSGGGLPTGALVGLIVGVVLGAVIVLIAVGIFVICYRGQKRKKAEALAGHAPPPPPLGPKDDPQHLRQNAAQFNMLPKPSPPPGFASNPSQLAVNVYPSMEPPSSNSSLGSEKPPARSPSPGMILGFYQSTYSYEELARATDNFSNMNLIGQGGFGYVHKGVLPNGKVVAIKQLKAGSGQGEHEFQAEVEIISRVHHRHLVSLVGCCIAGSQRMLVYEFVPNNTLEFHLHGKGRPVMNWPTRMKIALGSARGLAYLHEDCQPKIIHRDIKASNILLNDSFEAKVADFGLAKSSLDTDTHVSTRVMGTFGYLAPEYASSGKLTEKSDVFSFGVVLLELITGRRPVDRNRPFVDDSIVDWAKPLLTDALENGNFEALVDPRLEGDYDPSEMTRLAACAAACVRHSAKRRPKMSQIVRALEGNMSLDDLSYGVTPGHSSVFSSYGSSDYSSVQHKEDLEKFRKMVLESQVQSSSEYSGLTSEYGQNPSSSSTEGRQTTQEMESQRLEKDKEDFSKSS